MYQALYDILRESIFATAELTTYQAFTLEQVSVVLCVIVHLVPVIMPLWLMKRWLR